MFDSDATSISDMILPPDVLKKQKQEAELAKGVDHGEIREISTEEFDKAGRIEQYKPLRKGLGNLVDAAMNSMDPSAWLRLTGNPEAADYADIAQLAAMVITPTGFVNNANKKLLSKWKERQVELPPELIEQMIKRNDTELNKYLKGNPKAMEFTKGSFLSDLIGGPVVDYHHSKNKFKKFNEFDPSRVDQGYMGSGFYTYNHRDRGNNYSIGNNTAANPGYTDEVIEESINYLEQKALKEDWSDETFMKAMKILENQTIKSRGFGGNVGQFVQNYKNPFILSTDDYYKFGGEVFEGGKTPLLTEFNEMLNVSDYDAVINPQKFMDQYLLETMVRDPAKNTKSVFSKNFDINISDFIE